MDFVSLYPTQSREMTNTMVHMSLLHERLARDTSNAELRLTELTSFAIKWSRWLATEGSGKGEQEEDDNDNDNDNDNNNDNEDDEDGYVETKKQKQKTKKGKKKKKKRGVMCTRRTVWFDDARNNVQCNVHWFYTAVACKRLCSRVIQSVVYCDSKALDRLHTVHAMLHTIQHDIKKHWTSLPKTELIELPWFMRLIKGTLYCTHGRYAAKTLEDKAGSLHTGCLLLAETLCIKRKDRPDDVWLSMCMGSSLLVYFGLMSQLRYVAIARWAHSVSRYELMSGAWITAMQLKYVAQPEDALVQKTHELRKMQGHLTVKHILKKATQHSTCTPKITFNQPTK